MIDDRQDDSNVMLFLDLLAYMNKWQRTQVYWRLKWLTVKRWLIQQFTID